METKFEFRDPADLTIHPKAKLLPDWGNDDERFIAMVESIRDRGIDQPIIIDKEGRIIEGKMRFRAAKRLQLASVPIRVCDDDEVIGILLSSLIHRKHFTKSALAYLAYPFLKDAHEEAKRRQVENLRKGQQNPVLHAVQHGKKVEDFALQIGISRRLFCSAAEVHEIFAKDAAYKTEMEPRILAEPIGGEHEDRRPVGLGAVIAGYGGQKATKNQPKREVEQLELFESAVETTFHRLAKLPDVTIARPVIKRIVFETEPEDLKKLLDLAAEIQDQVKARTRALTAKGGLQ